MPATREQCPMTPPAKTTLAQVCAPKKGSGTFFLFGAGRRPAVRAALHTEEGRATRTQDAASAWDSAGRNRTARRVLPRRRQSRATRPGESSPSLVSFLDSLFCGGCQIHVACIMFQEANRGIDGVYAGYEEGAGFGFKVAVGHVFLPYDDVCQRLPLYEQKLQAQEKLERQREKLPPLPTRPPPRQGHLPRPQQLLLGARTARKQTPPPRQRSQRSPAPPPPILAPSPPVLRALPTPPTEPAPQLLPVAQQEPAVPLVPAAQRAASASAPCLVAFPKCVCSPTSAHQSLLQRSKTSKRWSQRRVEMTLCSTRTSTGRRTCTATTPTWSRSCEKEPLSWCL